MWDVYRFLCLQRPHCVCVCMCHTESSIIVKWKWKLKACRVNPQRDACLLVYGSSLKMTRMSFVLSVWGKSMLLLRLRAAHCDSLPIRVLRFQLAFFYKVRAAAPSLRSHFDLAEAREAGPPLSLVLSPDQEVFAPASKACPGISSNRAANAAALDSVEMEIERAASRALLPRL